MGFELPISPRIEFISWLKYLLIIKCEWISFQGTYCYMIPTYNKPFSLLLSIGLVLEENISASAKCPVGSMAKKHERKTSKS